jgi:hypothetical protein
MTIVPLNTISPLPFSEWMKHQEGIKPDTEQLLYTDYLHSWYVYQSKAVTTEATIKQNYITLLKELSFLIDSNDSNLFLSQIDFANDEDIILAIPYFVQKLKEICKSIAQKREIVKNTKLKYNLIGSNEGLESILYEYILKGFTHGSDNISTVPISNISQFFPQLSSVNSNFYIEVEELHDPNVYHDSDPSVPISSYVTLTDVENDIPFDMMSEDEIAGVLSSRFLSRISDTPLSKIFKQYLTDLPTLSTASLSSNYVPAVFNQIVASEKYLGERVYALTALRQSEVTTPDYILNLNFSQGNNWFFWPSGDKIYDDSKYVSLYAPIKINDSNLVKSGAYGTGDYTNSDLIFSDKNGYLEGAWLMGPRTVGSFDYMNMTIPVGTKRDFIFPFPGFNLTPRGNDWAGHSLNDNNFLLYGKLQPEQRQTILYDYFTKTLPNSSANSLYINDTTLVYNGALSDRFSDAADTVVKRQSNQVIDLVYNDFNKGNTEAAYLYKFLNTDFVIPIGTSDIVWPIGSFDVTVNLPITVLSDTCLPIVLGNTNPTQTIAGAIAGSDFGSSDKIYKMGQKSDGPVEAAWLGSGSITLLDTTNDSIDIYNGVSAIYCSSFLDGPVQGALSTKINGGEKISFVWMDIDTPADQVFYYREHQPDCPYILNGPYDYYSRQDYQNPNPLNNNQHWNKCTCKSTVYSPIGHQGNKATDYNAMTDFLFADPQGLGSSFAFNTWIDTRGLTPLNSPQFSFYYLDGLNGDNNVGWGSGFWKTGNGAPMILKTGRRYTYYRTALRTNNNTLTNQPITPYIVVNYPYKTIRGLYSNISNQYDLTIIIDNSYSQKDNIDTVINLVKNIVDNLLNKSNFDIKVSLISFNNHAYELSYLTDSSDIIKYNLSKINITNTYPDCSTNIYESLQLANSLLTTTISDDTTVNLYDLCNNLNSTISRISNIKENTNFPRLSATKRIMIFSDGYENINVGQSIPYATQLKNNGYEIYSIDIGPNSYFNTNMQQIGSTLGYFNLQDYLTSGDGDYNSFIQYIVSTFTDSNSISVTPQWYKATKDPNGNWISTRQISDMVLNPGDYLVYNHKAGADYTGPNNTSFVMPSINFAANYKLNGWDYVTNSFSLTAVGSAFGAKPFWGKMYNIPDSNNRFYKNIQTFGGHVRFLGDYVPINQPDISNMVLNNGCLLTYERKAYTNLVWNQPLSFTVTLSDYRWNKLVFGKGSSNFANVLRNGNGQDLIEYGSYEPSEMLLESYSEFLPARYNYYAITGVNYTENLFYSEKCKNTFFVFNTGIAIEPLEPFANLDNVHYPTIATASFPSLAVSDKQTGEYLLPENLGVSFYRGKGYKMKIDGSNLSYIDSISAERMFLDPEKYSSRHRGLTKKDQNFPVVIDSIDNRWMMLSFASANAAGMVTDTLNNQKFTPYQTKYEIDKRSDVGMCMQNDDLQFWNPAFPSKWDKAYKYPLTFRGELLESSYKNRKNNLLINKGTLSQWKMDIFGNNYGLYKIPNSAITLYPIVTSYTFGAGINNPYETYYVDIGGSCRTNWYVGTYTQLTSVSMSNLSNYSTAAPPVRAYVGGDLTLWYQIDTFPVTYL